MDVACRKFQKRPSESGASTESKRIFRRPANLLKPHSNKTALQTLVFTSAEYPRIIRRICGKPPAPTTETPCA
ncbi:hypothetical protein [Neisseria elongata]|uniref:hypothetical protein n=1 Tax=Neisseria elongata TaxID=495 RepID=UPI0006696002|nr:hypothetical protein [Neisseria elongata]